MRAIMFRQHVIATDEEYDEGIQRLYAYTKTRFPHEHLKLCKTSQEMATLAYDFGIEAERQHIAAGINFNFDDEIVLYKLSKILLSWFKTYIGAWKLTNSPITCDFSKLCSTLLAEDRLFNEQYDADREMGFGYDAGDSMYRMEQRHVRRILNEAGYTVESFHMEVQARCNYKVDHFQFGWIS